MVVEIVLAAVVIETVIWAIRERKQYNEKFDFHMKHLRESNTWWDLFEKTDELRGRRPDLYKAIRKPVVVRIIHRVYPDLK